MIINKIVTFTFFIALFLTGCSNNTEPAKTDIPELEEDEITALKIDNLLRDSLELTEGVEVVMSYLEIPKNTTLPAHYHPGEEFVYLIQGSGELTLKDQSKIIVKAGETAKVPLRYVHSFSSLNEDVKGVVFRVHEKGQPDRILVE